jgi:hypothetical protein
MTATQPDLFRAPKRPRSEEVELLCCLLKGEGWTSARTIGRIFQWSERKVRAVASASGGRILSCPGSEGYKLTREATSEERDMIVSKMLHQAREMTERAGAIGRVHRQSTHA